jgi:hypothetical protein
LDKNKKMKKRIKIQINFRKHQYNFLESVNLHRSKKWELLKLARKLKLKLVMNFYRGKERTLSLNRTNKFKNLTIILLT